MNRGQISHELFGFVLFFLFSLRDNLQLAYPILYSFGAANDTVPIHLARISCPASATDLNSCHLGGGWGSVAGCTHAMDVGVQCGPVASSTKTRELFSRPFYEASV